MDEIKIEFVYNNQVQQISEIRKILRIALLKAGLAVSWEEWKAADDLLPQRLQHSAPFALFMNEELLLGVASNFPTEPELTQLIQQKINKQVDESWWKKKMPKVNFSLISAIGVFLLPKCPICWAAYMSFFSALGFSSITYQSWWLPLMLTILFLSVGLSIYHAFIRKRYTYMGLILGGVTFLVLGKLVFDITFLMYTGIALLLIAYVRHQLILRNFNFRINII